MRWILLVIPMLIFANEAEKSDTIVNETKKEMLCVANYSSVDEMREENGRQRRVVVMPREEVISTIQPGASIKKIRKGTLTCYNEFGKVTSYERDDYIERTNEHQIKSHLSNHNKYDLHQYEGKNRLFVETNFGIAQRCAPYDGGEYCNHGFGLDIIYGKDEKIKTILFYANTVQRGKLPFVPESIMKLRSNTEPLGLWVTKSYTNLFSKKPTVHTQNLILWDEPSKHIKRVVMTPSKGYFELSRTFKDGHNLFRNGREEGEHPLDYVGAIEVQYQ